MKNYITWTAIQTEWWMLHPNTHDEDKTISNNTINFVQYGYSLDGVNLATIEYDENVVTSAHLIWYADLEPDFNITIITELQANELLKSYGQDAENNYYVSVDNFVFTDTRPEEDIPNN